MGNDYYRVVPSYLLTAIMALEAKPGAKGEDKAELTQPNSRFHVVLPAIWNRKKQYAVFLVRGNSFEVFRAARKEAALSGFEIGWELLGDDEPIKFAPARLKSPPVNLGGGAARVVPGIAFSAVRW